MGLARVVAAMAIGPIFDHLNDMLVLSICHLLYGTTLGLAPTWPSLPAFQAFMALVSAFDALLSLGKL